MTEEKISPELFEHLVGLAAIALDPTQSEYLRSELNKQLNVIEELILSVFVLEPLLRDAR